MKGIARRCGSKKGGDVLLATLDRPEVANAFNTGGGARAV